MARVDLIFKKFEQFLSNYPEEWQKNYYQNKEDLTIKYDEQLMDSKLADYDYKENVITLYDDNERTLPYGLFQMCFRDKDKINEEIFNGMICDNGISFRYSDDEFVYFGGFTDGFAVYLTRLYDIKNGYNINYNSFDNIKFFFIDLLVSIYGETILGYLFKNDLLGFFGNKKFYDIYEFAEMFDNLYLIIEDIYEILDMKQCLEEIIEEDDEALANLVSTMSVTMQSFNNLIMNMFNHIITEYLVYEKPNIERQQFLDKIYSFLNDEDYKIAFCLMAEKFGVKKCIEDNIEKIKKYKRG